MQHLLDMRAGTRFNEDYDDLDADVRLYERVYLWRPRRRRAAPADALAYFATLLQRRAARRPVPLPVDPHRRARLGARAGRRDRLHELISRDLWQPMGAEYDAEITLDGHGNAMADGGICATLRDLARFGRCTCRAGHRARAWIADTVRGAPDGAAAFVAGDDPARGPPGAHYRNCWWVRDPSAAVPASPPASTARTSTCCPPTTGGREVLDLADAAQ